MNNKLILIFASLRLCALFLFIITTFRATSQYTIERADSTHYRFCTTTQDQSGAISKSCSPATTRDSAVAYLGALADRQHAYIEARPWEADWNAIDTALMRYSGRTYAQHIKAASAASLAGDWDIISGSDTIIVKVGKDLKVTGGKIRGDIELIDNKSIRISGVLAKPVTLTAEKGRLRGKLDDKEVIMHKS